MGISLAWVRTGYERFRASATAPALEVLPLAHKSPVPQMTPVPILIVVLERFITAYTPAVGHSVSTAFKDVIASMHPVTRRLLFKTCVSRP